MAVLFRRLPSVVRRARPSLTVTMLEQRNLLAAAAGGLPGVDLSAATINALGQSLANLVSRIDSAHALTDLNNAFTAINNDISQLLEHPVPNAGLQQALLQIDIDTLAVVDQAIADLTPSTGNGGGGVTILA